MPDSSSYVPMAECCGVSPRHCDKHGADPAEPCWGKVEMDGDDYGEGTVPFHRCQGHAIGNGFGQYVPEPVPAGTTPLSKIDADRMLAFAIKCCATAAAPFAQTFPQTVRIGDFEYTQVDRHTATIRSLVPLEVIRVDFEILADGTVHFMDKP